MEIHRDAGKLDELAPLYSALLAHHANLAAGPDDMWVTGDRIAEVQTLCVQAADRSSGIGTTLLDAINSELGGQGVRDIQLAVVATNADAIRLYQRRGFTPRLVVLSNYARS